MSVLASPEAVRAAATSFTSVKGVAEVVAGYDGFLIDQWGVLHDGKRAYAGAVEALQRLGEAGKTVVILSNSGRRAAENEDLLAAMGFDRSLYKAVMPAGDDARDAILNDPDPFYAGLGKRCLLMARDGEDHLADGLGLELVREVDDADFLLLLSMEPAYQSVQGWNGLLRKAAARGLPMICANPDFVRVSPEGKLLEAPGAVARVYETLGGAVRYHGKPHQRIYATCLKLLGLPAERVAAIGDSLDHDVAGARMAALGSIFVAGGIHYKQLHWTGGMPDPEDCARLFAETGLVPDFMVPSFRW